MRNGFARTLFENRPRDPEDFEIYRAQLDAFHRKFGRAMGPDDPFFFDPDAETPQFRSPRDAAEVVERMAELMAQAGVDAAAIYAFKRTRGLFPTLGPPFSDEELAEWTAALHEYYEQIESGREQ